MLTKKDRVNLVLSVAAELDSPDVRWDSANIILSTYGIQELDPDQFGPTTAQIVDTATDEQLKEIADHFEITLPEDLTPVATAKTTANSSQPLFIFASHLSSKKAIVHEVADGLIGYGITLFVAHDSIEPDSEWHQEIEKALDRADAGLVFLHEGFRDSTWCDQEVGWLLGRHVPVMALRFDIDPYGPLGKTQATPVKLTDSNRAIIDTTLERIAGKPQLRSGLASSLITAIRDSPSFADTDRIWRWLRTLTTLEASQCAALLEAMKTNGQISGAQCRVETPYRSYTRVILDFLRGQPGGAVIKQDLDAYEAYLKSN